MSHRFVPVRCRAVLPALGFAFAAAAAHASQDYAIVVGSCPPITAAAMHYDIKLSSGAVRKAGRNPPTSRYFCQVPVDDLAAAPSWNVLALQFRDRNLSGDGHVVARLVRKSLSSGGATAIATVSSVPSATVKTVATRLHEPIDFSRYAYFVAIELSTPLEPVEAHLVRLSTR